MRHDPVIVGALGGSGTRVVARLIRLAGVFMGEHVNYAEDSEPIMHFYNDWLRRIVAGGEALTETELAAAEARFNASLAEHLLGLGSPEAPWGVKVPRNILMLPFWHRAYPELKFVHVLRDGRDMAYSADRNQLRMVGDLVLSPEERRYEETRQVMAYWRRVNLAAADFGEQRLGGRYLRVRFEDLCTAPVQVCEALWAFVGAADPMRLRLDGLRQITPPPSLGRWRTHSAGDLAELEAAGAPALGRFGYIDP